MRFVQYYQMSTGYIEGTNPPQFDDKYKKPEPALGSEAITILDGRWKRSTYLLWAFDDAKSPRRHRYCGFVVMEGDKISTAKPITEYFPINTDKYPVHSAAD